VLMRAPHAREPSRRWLAPAVLHAFVLTWSPSGSPLPGVSSGLRSWAALAPRRLRRSI